MKSRNNAGIFFIHLSFYLDESDDNNPKIKWRNIPVHDFQTIYRRLELRKVLDDEFDERNTPIEELSVEQLRYECDLRGLDSSGYKKVLVSTLMDKLGKYAKVQFDTIKFTVCGAIHLKLYSPFTTNITVQTIACFRGQ